MFIDLIFSDQQIITIECFDHAAIKEWFDALYQEQSLNGKLYKTKSKKYLTQQQISNSWNNIQQSLEDLKKYNFTIPNRIPTIWNGNQSELNYLHRFFTHNTLWRNENSDQPNPFDKDFIFPQNLDVVEWERIMSTINESVHILEKVSVHTDNSKIVDNNFPVEDLALTFDPALSWCYFSKDTILHNYNYWQYCDQDNLVTLSRTILGKCLLQSFYDDDDPNDKDCTGRNVSNGNLSIDYLGSRKKIYFSDIFKNWIEKHKLTLTDLPLEFVIGKINHIPKDLIKDQKQTIKIQFRYHKRI
jgi:hypothetical protein